MFLELVALFTLALGCPNSGAYSTLRTRALQNADPGSMPAMRPVRVGLALTVWKVHGIDYKKGELTLTVWLKMYWADPRLAYESYDLVPEWDSATMNVGAPLDSIWYPDVQLNEVSSDALQEETNFVYGVSIYDKHFMEAKKWNVAWSRQLVLTASCSLYLAAFPFDAQYCTLSFSSWKYSSVHIRITEPLQGMPTPVVVQENYGLKYALDDSSFILRTINMTLGWDTERGGGLYYFMTLKRSSRYYICNIVWPLWVVTHFAYLAFFLRIDIYDRVFLALSCLLMSFSVVFLTSESRGILGDDTWLDEFQTGCIALCLVPAVETVLVSRIRASLVKPTDHDSSSMMVTSSPWSALIVMAHCKRSDRLESKGSYVSEAIETLKENFSKAGICHRDSAFLLSPAKVHESSKPWRLPRIQEDEPSVTQLEPLDVVDYCDEIMQVVYPGLCVAMIGNCLRRMDAFPGRPVRDMFVR